MTHQLHAQGERLYEVFADLVRAYQYRDREQICCWGLSISQCHSLEALYANGPMTMSELAKALFLEASTVTRIVDRLVEADLVERTSSATDRRVCRVAITAAGRRLMSRIRGDLIEEHVEVLRQVPTASREAVITALQSLYEAFQARQTSSDACTSPAGSARR